MDYLAQAANVAWDMLYDAGIYVAFGFLAAGLVHVLVSRAWMTRHLGGKGFGAVVKAALIGAPLPLCSCSVLPFAY
ncbi:MAG: permease, partial [Planctomycetota bacterium]|nr:permease [Planctomycetota bacterium]